MIENDHDDAEDNREHDSQITTDSALILGATSSSMNEEELVMSNPHLKKLFNKMLDERIKKANESGETSTSQILSMMTPKSNKRGKEVIKSPSDMTVYIPALQKVGNKQTNVVGLHKHTFGNENMELNELTVSSPVERTNNGKDINNKSGKVDNDLIERISLFVDQLCVEQDHVQAEEEEDTCPTQLKSTVKVPGYDEAKRRSEQAIIEAEK